MKKIFLILAVIYSSVLLGQTIVTTYPLNIRNPRESDQILNFENTLTHEVIAFVSSGENFTILKYNSALFLKDQFTGTIEYKNRSVMGYSFSEDGNPTLYWYSEISKDIIIVKYYFETKTSKALKFEFAVSSESIVTSFQKDNAFNLLTQHKSAPALILYVFKNGIVQEKILDFTPFKFQDRKTQPKSFNQILRDYPIEKMEPGEYNPLSKVVSKTKLYLLSNRLILTFDHSLKKTQLFDINLSNLEIKEQNFLQPDNKKVSKSSNSYYHENRLFQVNTNADELLMDVKNLESGTVLKSITVAKNDTIRFKNSPLLVQRDNFKPVELKNTAKFLQQLSSSDIGVSVFKNQKNLFITIGGQQEIDLGFDGFTPIVETKNIFFETIWDKSLEFTTEEQQPLALDKIYIFLDSHKEVSLENIMKFKDYFILGYFDTKTKQYTMRKFTDGYEQIF
jgi:hypothetical protein